MIEYIFTDAELTARDTAVTRLANRKAWEDVAALLVDAGMPEPAAYIYQALTKRTPVVMPTLRIA